MLIYQTHLNCSPESPAAGQKLHQLLLQQSNSIVYFIEINCANPSIFLRANYVSIDYLLFYCISFRLLKIQNLAPANWFNVEKWSICFYFDRGKNLNHSIKGLNLALLTSSWCSRWTSFGLNNLPFLSVVEKWSVVKCWRNGPHSLDFSLSVCNQSYRNWIEFDKIFVPNTPFFQKLKLILIKIYRSRKKVNNKALNFLLL